MNKLYTLITLFFILGAISLKAQESINEPCGLLEIQKKYYENNPDLKVQDEQMEMDFILNGSDLVNKDLSTLPDTVIIPIVFHIVHNNGSENVSNALIHQTVEQLNLDYNSNNADLSTIVTGFEDIIGDVKFEFRLAQYDPEGNCTTGITRHVSDLTYTGGDEVKEEISGWPRNSYLNVWVCKIALDLGDPSFIVNGFAPFPSWVNASSDAWQDGVVIRSDAIGLNQRTLSHEVGHWSNLRHTWGNTEVGTTCTGNDLVSDTPSCMGSFGGCNTSYESCGSLDNVQNFMEYSDCSRMFTQGQVTRMRNALDNTTAQRNQLYTDANLEDTGVLLDPVLCEADFRSNKQRICTGMNVEYTNLSGNGDTEWTWTFEGGDPATSDEENPVVAYNTTGLYEVTLTAGNGVDEVSETKTDYILVLEDNGMLTPIEEGFENVSSLPNENWVIQSSDQDRYWEITDAASASGSKSVVLKNYYQSLDNEDHLESNPIDLSDLDDVNVTFKYSYAKRNASNTDVLKFEITRTCGNVWVTRETLKASDETLVTAPNHLGYFTPESNEWGEALVDNISSLYLISNFRIRFEFTSGEGNNVYIDDINIYDPATVGINEVNKAALKFKAYPNPADENLAIQFNLLHDTNVKGEVFDISGRLVESLFDESFQLGVNELNYNIQDWPSGVYFLTISLEGERFIEKIVKK